MPANSATPRRFDIALSFPGEHRGFVEQVATQLAATFGQERVLYDKYHKAEFAAPDLDVYLPNLYRTQSELIVLFLCPEYAAKRWCRLEWRFIRQMLATVDARRIMFLSFGDPGDVTELGILSGDGYLEIDTSNAKEIVDEILKRLHLNQGNTPPPVSKFPDISTIRRSLFEAKTPRELQEFLFQAQALVQTPEVKLLVADIERALARTRSPVQFANDAYPEVDVSRIIKYAPAELIGREAENKLLSDAWDKAVRGEKKRPHILTFVALGGEGKTSLVAKWAAELAGQDWPGCDAVFAWSFYSQGTRDQAVASSDIFLKEALTFFGDAAMAGSAQSAFDKGRRLAQLVGERRALLVLDGLEPLQYAPTSPMPGELKDQGIAALLKALATTSQGLCVVTTRYSIPDLRAYWQTTAPEKPLPRLSKEAGVALLRSFGVKGTQKEFEKLVEDVKGHALTLNLLGTYLRDAHAGDIRKRDLVKLEEADAEEQGGHAFRVMDAYVRALEQEGTEETEARRSTSFPSVSSCSKGQHALAILRLLGLFDRPATADCLEALWKAPAIAGLTESLVGLSEAQRNIVLTRLESAKLLTVNRDAAGRLLSLDAHPLLREYFARAVRSPGFSRSGAAEPPKGGTTSEVWRAAHRRLYEHLCATTKEGDQPTLEDLQPLYQAVGHGCQAGLQQEALSEVFGKRILRGREYYSSRKLGAFGSNLASLTSFFNRQWSELTELDDLRDQGFVLEGVGVGLRGLGRLLESIKPLTDASDRYLKRPDWQRAAANNCRIVGVYLLVGNISDAISIAEKNLQTADQSSDAKVREDARSVLAVALFQAGRRKEAEKLFLDAEAILVEDQGASAVLNSYFGYQYCDFLIEAARYEEAERRADLTLQTAVSKKILLNTALDNLSIGRVRFHQLDFLRATKHLQKAIEDLRNAGTQHELPRGLIARAWLRSHTGPRTGSESAQSDLDEAWEIAERGPMPLFQADIHLHRARLFGRMKDEGRSMKEEPAYPWESPQADLAEARRLIYKHGYLRRKEELEDAEQALLR